MSLSKEQWMAIEECLSVPFGHAKLKCDGYEITAQVRCIGALKLVIGVFVDGEMKGAWLDGQDERCLKFYQKKTRYLLQPDIRKKALAACKDTRWSKEERKFFKVNAEKTFEYWQPYWSTPKAFCRHISKTCAQIEFME